MSVPKWYETWYETEDTGTLINLARVNCIERIDVGRPPTEHAIRFSFGSNDFRTETFASEDGRDLVYGELVERLTYVEAP